MLFRKFITVESFEKITLTMSGMRSIDEYEIICSGDKVEIAQYLVYYTKDNDREAVNKAEYDTAKFISFLNECKIGSWDGFYGKNPRGVKDGYMFRFTAEINGGKVISAEGSNNYPSHFSEFRQGLTRLLYDEEI